VSRLTYIYTTGQIYKLSQWRFAIYNANVGDYSLTILYIESRDDGIYPGPSGEEGTFYTV